LRRAASKRSCTTEIVEVVGQLLSEPSGLGSQLPILRAQTLTLLEALGPGHKRILLQFLYELSLLGPERPGLSLQGANLREANLAGASLGETSLERVHLKRANLAEANLVGANLRRANLKEADLSRAFLQGITKESLTQTQINEAVGNDATKLPDHLQRPAHWRGGLEGRD
jgi:uncharacterized protein YjbI with pentapeptide repeats